jgi:hypothetical protein
MNKPLLSQNEKRRLQEVTCSLRAELLQLRAGYLASGCTAAEWNDVCGIVLFWLVGDRWDRILGECIGYASI